MPPRPSTRRAHHSLYLLVLSSLAWMPAVCGAQKAAPDEHAQADAITEPASEMHTIAWHWPTEPVRYELVRSTMDALPVPGKDPVTTQSIARVVRHEQADTDTGEPRNGNDDATPVRLTWESIRFEQDDSLNTPLSYDSTKEHHWSRTRHPLIGAVASSLDQAVTLTMRPDGTPAGMRALEAYLRGIERNLTKWGLASDRTYEQLQRTYTPEALISSMRATYGFLPTEPLAVGDSYEISRPFTFQHVRTLESAETHTLESIETTDDGRTIAHFVISGTIRWPDPGGLESQIFNVSLDKVTLNGAWDYDLTRGLVIKYHLKTSFISDIVRYDPRDRSSTEMSTRQSLTDTMKLLESTPEADAPSDSSDSTEPDPAPSDP
jgi:hypothetical protein